MSGDRIDRVLARLLPQHSRTRIKSWIAAGAVRIGARAVRPSEHVDAGVRVSVAEGPPVPRDPPVLAEAIARDLIHEDRDCLVVNKPVGLVVHPGAGNREHTLQNALLGLDPNLARLPRAGIVHRLDKDTSGVLVIARTAEAYTSLSRQLLARTVAREYQAVAAGVMTSGGTLDLPIGRHRSDRLRQTVRGDGRPAVTHYRVLQRFRAHTHVAVALETGRTHQIRVHLAHVAHPLVGDPVYGGRHTRPRGASAALVGILHSFRRQALHAATLSFDHPRTGRRRTFTSPVPADFAALLAALARDVRDAEGGA